ncbi:hypothetical protein, partial [Halocynthiibacter styelae]
SGGEKFVDALFEATHDIIKNKKQKLKKYKPNQNTPGIQIAAQHRQSKAQDVAKNRHAPLAQETATPKPVPSLQMKPIQTEATEKQGFGAKAQPSKVAGSNQKIWKNLISEDRPETVDELVATIERFLVAADQRSRSGQHASRV